MRGAKSRSPLFMWAVTVFAALAPPLLTLALFLVLYNNFTQGRLIFLALIALNSVALALPGKRLGLAGSFAPAKVACAYTVAFVFAALGVEMLFPWALPARYAQMRDLSKAITGVSDTDRELFPVVFTNADRQERSLSTKPGDRPRSVAWHEPGKDFEYFGYDPNERIRYVNIIRWNSQGYFDRDYTRDKSPHLFRIALIGDSYVESIQAPLNRTFHKLLETGLNEAVKQPASASPRFEVMALGNSGAGQVALLNALKTEAIKYSPDLVIFTLAHNDSCDDDPELNRERNLSLGEATPFLRNLVRHGYFALSFALFRYRELQRNRLGISPELLQWSASDIPRIEAAWQRTLAAVKDARDFCRTRGIGFRLVYLGSELELKYALDPEKTLAELRSMGGPHRQTDWDLTRSVNRVRDFCEKNDIPFTSLLDPLARAQKETGKFIFGDHFTFFGHEVVAKTLNSALPPDLDGGGSRGSSR
ncbi:MAG: SGNH/GDSL hydrolase family protein [Deltaproteobacteria bacterium]|nr:SGNH/GDSL hydrolase family protein [Deltaproteobacteria bacterium]